MELSSPASSHRLTVVSTDSFHAHATTQRQTNELGVPTTGGTNAFARQPTVGRYEIATFPAHETWALTGPRVVSVQCCCVVIVQANATKAPRLPYEALAWRVATRTSLVSVGVVVDRVDFGAIAAACCVHARKGTA